MLIEKMVSTIFYLGAVSVLLASYWIMQCSYEEPHTIGWLNANMSSFVEFINTLS